MSRSDGPVLVLGGSGNVGRLVLEQLIGRGYHVRAILRSEGGLPASVTTNPNFSAIHANLLDLSPTQLEQHIEGCCAVISTLGHGTTLRGIYGPPYSLVTEATKRICRAVEALRPSRPIRYVMLNTAGVLNPDGDDRKRSWAEAAVFMLIRLLVPPFADSINSAVYLSKEIGSKSKFLEWTAVRPDVFCDGGVSRYSTHEKVQKSLFDHGHTTKANIAHFICQLVDSPQEWQAWKGKMPVIYDASDDH
mmetsp:Transcript_26935/g.58836  ORF Transcript_26935/g.58836 Transcript_26935/m.58836 type:complete len:248 (+) Transcript_26935:220-963(+)